MVTGIGNDLRQAQDSVAKVWTAARDLEMAIDRALDYDTRPGPSEQRDNLESAKAAARQAMDALGNAEYHLSNC